jgi:hypothetical protein
MTEAGCVLTAESGGDSTATVEDSAAATVLEAVDSVSSEGPILLVTRGEHAFWDAVHRMLTAANRPVIHRVLDRNSKIWDPLSALRDLDGVRAVVYHDPFGPTESSGCTTEDIQEAVASGVGLVFVEFAHGLRDVAAERQLTAVYLTALSEPWSDLHKTAERVETLLADAMGLEIVFDGFVLRVGRPWSLRNDWTSAVHDVPVRQLPNGEVWLACDPERVNGEIVLAGGGSLPAEVRSGLIMRPDLQAAASPDRIVEIGIGLNPAAPWLRGTSLVEKAAGRLHVGFGDNALLGGAVHAPHHYDVPLVRDCQAWAVHDDGRRVRVAPFR